MSEIEDWGAGRDEFLERDGDSRRCETCEQPLNAEGLARAREVTMKLRAEQNAATIKSLTDRLAGAVDALRALAAIHHDTLTPSRKHDPENRVWTECGCRTCLLAQRYAGGQ